jgi:CheY-like chemotaxis protein
VHIVVVEDDHLQAGPLAENLRAAFDNPTVETMATEEDFRAAMPRLRDEVPDLLVMDVMLRWASPRPGMSAPPPDVVSGGYYRAGLRCAALLHADPTLRSVPVVLYTILEVSDLRRGDQELPPNTTYVGKTAELDVLVRHVRAQLRER